MMMKKSLRSAICIMLAGCTLLGAAGCGKTDGGSSAGSSTAKVSSLDEIKKKGELVVAIETNYPPYDFVDTSKPGSLGPVIGIHFGNTYLNDKSPASDWDNVLNGLFKNYNVEFKPGTLTVQDLPEGMPEISDIPSIERHWNFLFDDNPWDRNRDFRERKAEVHFVAGGMTL